MTRALVQWAEGWKYRGAPGDHTVALSHSDYTIEADVDRLVDAELAESTDDETTVAIAAGIEPRNGDDAPYTNFNLGDAVSLPDINGVRQTWRTVSIKVRETPLNVVQVGIEANSRIEDDVARLRRFANLATPGTLSGRGDNISASDLGAGVEWGVLPKSELGTYQWSGPLVAEVDAGDPSDPGHSPWWPLDENVLIYRHPWSLTIEGDTATVVVLRYREPNQTTIHEYGYTIPAGVFQPDDSPGAASFYSNLSAMKGGAIQVAVTTAGDSAEDIVWRTKYTSQT